MSHDSLSLSLPHEIHALWTRIINEFCFLLFAFCLRVLQEGIYGLSFLCISILHFELCILHDILQGTTSHKSKHSGLLTLRNSLARDILFRALCR